MSLNVPICAEDSKLFHIIDRISERLPATILLKNEKLLTHILTCCIEHMNLIAKEMVRAWPIILRFYFRFSPGYT